jgi:DNA end-binding protein Ku
MLILQTMFFADEVRDPKDQIDDLPRRGAAKKSELSMAQQLIDSMSGVWRPADFRDTYTDRVKKMIKQKEKGKEITTAEPAPEPTNVTDLLEVLRQSVDRAKTSRSAKAPKKSSTAKTATNSSPAKKTAAKSSPAKKTATKTSSAKKTAAGKTGAKKAGGAASARKSARPAKKAS